MDLITTDHSLKFWWKAANSLQQHPDDEAVLRTKRHHFRLDTLVGPFQGPVRTAPVVLLTLNPGWSGVEPGEAKMPKVREAMVCNLKSDAPLTWFETNPEGLKWTRSVVQQFGVTYDRARMKVCALMSRCAKRSADLFGKP
jgi:hypothetical protein